YYFREAITWSLITSGGFSMRYREPGSIHDVSGMSAFALNETILKRVLGLMNTPVSNLIFKMLNPTINLQVGDFTNFPVLDNVINSDVSDKWVSKSIQLSKQDWDAFEISWDFQNLPMLVHIAEHTLSPPIFFQAQTSTSAKNVPKFHH
ncbi:MAG: restriction endonuclease subunit M, partial [Oenococcus sp.]